MNDRGLAGRQITIVISSLGAGGAERVVAELSDRWIRAGASVTVIAFDGPADPIYHHFPEKVRFRRLALPAACGWAVQWRRVVALRRALRLEAPDVVISFLTKINVLSLASTIGTDVPVIVAERNNLARQPMSLLWKIGLGLLYARAAAMVCQTEASRGCLPRHVRSRAVVISNPVVAPHFGRAPTGSPCVAAVGRLTPQKGFDLLIDAFARIAPKHRDWCLDIWGEGPERAVLQAHIDRLGMQQRVKLRGLSSRPGAWAREADVFVLSSRYEGFPNVLGEAMAAGLPVVATHCRFGPAELVEDGETGLLVAPCDAEALACGLDQLLGDPALRERVGRAAPRIVQRFNPDSVARLWEQLLQQVVGRRSAPARFDEEHTADR